MSSMLTLELRTGLKINPYLTSQNNNSATSLTKAERQLILTLLLRLAHVCAISDQAFLLAVHLFDRSLERLHLDPHKGLSYVLLGVSALYLASKYEDLKYPYFQSY